MPSLYYERRTTKSTVLKVCQIRSNTSPLFSSAADLLSMAVTMKPQEKHNEATVSACFIDPSMASIMGDTTRRQQSRPQLTRCGRRGMQVLVAQSAGVSLTPPFLPPALRLASSFSGIKSLPFAVPSSHHTYHLHLHCRPPHTSPCRQYVYPH